MLSPKDPSEQITVTFDFTNLVSTITSVVSVVVTVISGTDASPSSMLASAASISGTQVLQALHAGVTQVAYKVTCTITSGSNIYVLSDSIWVLPA